MQCLKILSIQSYKLKIDFQALLSKNEKLQNKVKKQDKQLKEIEELLEDNLHTHFQEFTELELKYKKLELEFNNLHVENINIQELYNLQKNINPTPILT